MSAFDRLQPHLRAVASQKAVKTVSLKSLLWALSRESLLRQTILLFITVTEYVIIITCEPVRNLLPQDTTITDYVIQVVVFMLPFLAVTSAGIYTTAKTSATDARSNMDVVACMSRAVLDLPNVSAEDKTNAQAVITVATVLPQLTKESVEALFKFFPEWGRYERVSNPSPDPVQAFDTAARHFMRAAWKVSEKMPDAFAGEFASRAMSVFDAHASYMRCNDSTLPPHFILWTDALVYVFLALIVPCAWTTMNYWSIIFSIIFNVFVGTLATMIKEVHPPHTVVGAHQSSHITDEISPMSDILNKPTIVPENESSQFSTATTTATTTIGGGGFGNGSGGVAFRGSVGLHIR